MRKYPQQSERVKEFIEIVCSQVKSKWAHNLLSYELSGHIEDQKSAYMEAGIDELTAELRAIEDMGDPVEAGGQFNKVHRHRPDTLPNIIMWVIAGIITLTGTVSGGILFFTVFMAGRQYILATAIGVSFILFSLLIAFTFITMWKTIADMILGYQLVSDYKRRRDKMSKK